MTKHLVFGYTDVAGVSCGLCGSTHLMMESDPLGDVLRCWCGSTSRVHFDDDAEREAFIAANAPVRSSPS